MRGQTAGTRYPKKSPADGEARRQRVERVKTWRAEMRESKTTRVTRWRGDGGGRGVDDVKQGERATGWAQLEGRAAKG